MSIAEDFAFVVIEPTSGKPQISSMNLETTFGGAILLDLVADERVTLIGEGKKAKVQIADRSPSGSALHDAAVARIKKDKPIAVTTAVQTLGKKTRKNAYAALTDHGRVRHEPSKALGLFPVDRWPVVDVSGHAELRERIRRVLVHGAEADDVTGPLIGLLSAGDAVGAVTDKHERKQAKRVAKEVAKGDWASEAVKNAIAQTQAAITAAIVASSAAAASSG